MTMPGFTSSASLYRSSERYGAAWNVPAVTDGVAPQLPIGPLQLSGLACAVYAAMCAALTEDPPAAAWCWWDFAQRCGGGSALTSPLLRSFSASVGGLL
jgi:hypothetical protein